MQTVKLPVENLLHCIKTCRVGLYQKYLSFMKQQHAVLKKKIIMDVDSGRTINTGCWRTFIHDCWCRRCTVSQVYTMLTEPITTKCTCLYFAGYWNFSNRTPWRLPCIVHLVRFQNKTPSAGKKVRNINNKHIYN